MLAVLSVVACGATSADAIRREAAERLHCPAGEVTVVSHPNDQFEAYGCGGRATCGFVNGQSARAATRSRTQPMEPHCDPAAPAP